MMEETRVLDRDELKALLEQINTRTPSGSRNYALLQLMAQTGIRVGEALQVKPRDIGRENWPTNGGRRKVWVLRLRKPTTKGQKAREPIGLTLATTKAIEGWREKRAALRIRGGPLFCTISRGTRRAGFVETDGQAKLKRGEKLNPSYIRALVKRLATKAGIERPVSPHVFRHTALTAVYDETKDLRRVQKLAGHTSSRSTERYTHVHPIGTLEAMEAIERADDEEGEQGPTES